MSVIIVQTIEIVKHKMLESTFKVSSNNCTHLSHKSWIWLSPFHNNFRAKKIPSDRFFPQHFGE